MRSPRLARWSFVSALVAVPLALLGCGGVVVRDVNTAPGHNVITVVGHGEVDARPDIATATIGVETNAPTVGQAMQDATMRMNAVVTSLRALGIADQDMRTNVFSVNLERLPEPPPVPVAPEPPPTKGSKAATREMAPASAPVAPPTPGYRDTYRVANTIEVTLRDITKASAMFDAAVRAGANNVYGLSFSLDDPRPLEAKARDAAVVDARARAEALARVSGAKLGRVVRVSEIVGGGGPGPMFAPMAREMSAMPPVEAGQIHVVREVQIDYAIVAPGDDEDGEKAAEAPKAPPPAAPAAAAPAAPKAADPDDR